MNTRIIVCGNKDFTDRDFCIQKLNEMVPRYVNPEIVSGHARGADTFGEEYAKIAG